MMEQLHEQQNIILSLENLTLKISGLVALNDVSIDVPSDQVVSLIGPNGAGKTTAFNVISGYMLPTKGDVKFLGKSIAGKKPEDIARLGLVRSFQRTSVFGENTVFENILTALHMQGSCGLLRSLARVGSFRQEEKQLRQQAHELIEFLGLGHRESFKAMNLAYGEQRVLGVGIALAARPKLLLLDEPAAGLNPSETENFKEMIRRVAKTGVTVLLVEHDMKMVMSISDQVIVLNQGCVIAQGTPSEIQQNAQVIQAYLGTGLRHA